MSSDRVDSSLQFENSEESDRFGAPEITELGKRVVSGKGGKLSEKLNSFNAKAKTIGLVCAGLPM